MCISYQRLLLKHVYVVVNLLYRCRCKQVHADIRTCLGTILAL